MKEFLIYLLKTGVCLTIFLVVYHIFLRSTTFFKLSRTFLLGGLILSFIIPAVTYTYDVINVAPFVSPAEKSHLISEPTISKVSEVDVNYSNLKPVVETKNSNILMIKLYTVWKVLFIIYIVLVALILIRNILMQLSLLKLSVSGTKTTYQGYNLIDTPLAKTPFAAFNTIYADMSKISDDSAKASILKHETIHIKQRHWVDLMLAEFALILQWFNPVMWMYIRRIRDNHEYLADRGVLKMGVSTSTYKAVLINERMQADIFRVASPFKGANSLGRLAMMKKERTAAWKKILILAILPALGVFLWISAEPNYLLFNLDSFSVKMIGDVTAVDKDGYPVVDGVSAQDIYYLSQSGSFEHAIPASLRTAKMSLYARQGTDGTLVIKTEPNSNGISNTDLIDRVKNLPDIIMLIDGNASSEEDVSRLDIANIASVSYLIDNKMLSLSDDMITLSVMTGGGEKLPLVVKTDDLDIALAKGYDNALNKITHLPVLMDGKIQTVDNLKQINPGKIKVLSILTTPKYTREYGNKAKDGIVLVR